MATLSFSKQGGAFVATFQVAGAWNLHIEGVNGVEVQQKSPSASNYASAWRSQDFEPNTDPDIIDQDFEHGVYPKDIKVLCWSEPKNASYLVASK